MEIEKAIELFENCDTVTFIVTGCGEESHKTIELKDVVQALKKQVPKSVTDEGRKLIEDTAYCPVCGAFLSKHHKFCFNCGQALKVGDEQ